jgi:hypothetical protein
MGEWQKHETHVWFSKITTQKDLNPTYIKKMLVVKYN